VEAYLEGLKGPPSFKTGLDDPFLSSILDLVEQLVELLQKR